MKAAEALGLVRDVVDETEVELGTMSPTRVAAQIAAAKMFKKLKEKFELKEVVKHESDR